MKPSFLYFAIFALYAFFATANKIGKIIELELRSTCSEKYIVKAFSSNPKIKFVKPNFFDVNKKKLKIMLVKRQTLSNYQIRRIAKKAKCKVTLIRRV